MLNTDFKFGEVYDIFSHITGGDDKIRFNKIFDNANGGVSLLAFRGGQSLTEHIAPDQVMVFVLDGNIMFSMLGRPHDIKAGEFLLMGQNVPHSVVAKTDSVVMLVKIKAENND